MIRTIICEDEYWVRKGIINLIPWNEFGLEFAGEFENATDAIEFLKVHPIDLVITDMNMNNGDGCTLLDYLCDTNTDCEKIIISGYTDFEYTKKAINSSVCEYLLKPVEETELRNVLIKAIDKIHTKLKDRMEQIQVQEKMQQTVPLLQEKLLNSLVSPEDFGKEKIIEELSKIGFELNDKYFTVQILYIAKLHSDSSLTTLTEEELGTWTSFIEEKITRKDCILFKSRHRKEEFILLWEGTPNRTLHRTLIFTEFQKLGDYKGYTMKSGTGTFVKGYQSIPLSYRQAKATLEYELINQPFPQNVFFDDIKDLNHSTCSYTPDEKLLTGIIKNRNRKMIPLFIQHIGSISKTSSYYHLPTYKNAVIRAAMQLEKACFEKDMKNPELSDTVTIVTPMCTTNRINQYLIKIFNDILDEIEKAKAPAGKNVIEEICEYVKVNYGEEISLIAFAQKYYMNHIYLSRLFKSETGENFSSFLTRIRMEKARELLSSDSFLIKEIAEMVGYENPYYFTKAFKKYFACSPTLIEKLDTKEIEG
ncbi:helix-turn-helix domain-containing protein [uncultured Robinsoniella sp.]|uniref:helix-turn-helix domain-containing protein n=1 Tax=uncultured Robinsoniella sp. TaxID=904190 RepID=UPI00374FBA68